MLHRKKARSDPPGYKKFNCNISSIYVTQFCSSFRIFHLVFANSIIFCFNKLIFFSSQNSYVMFQHLFFRPVYRVCIHSKKKVVHTPCILELLSSSEINTVSVSRSCILLTNKSNIVLQNKSSILFETFSWRSYFCYLVHLLAKVGDIV